MAGVPPSPDPQHLDEERWAALQDLEDWLETPMVVLGFVWLVLLVLELTSGMTPLMETTSTVIWGVFLLDFGLRLTLAPRKGVFLRENWLTLISLALPALRVFRLFRTFRVLRVARATRGTRLLSVIGSLNRGMRALRASFRRRGMGYLAALTLIVAFVGAAGMLAFERMPNGTGLTSYTDALWWTGMLLTTLGSEYWPVTGEGRVLAFILSVYAVGVFGYLTASLATYFIGIEAENQVAAADGDQIADLRREVEALREEIRAFAMLRTPSPPNTDP